MIRRHFLCADYIKMFVLDEADEMLTRGLKDQVGVISTTMPPDALEKYAKQMPQCSSSLTLLAITTRGLISTPKTEHVRHRKNLKLTMISLQFHKQNQKQVKMSIFTICNSR